MIVPRFVGVVTEDGLHFLPHRKHPFKAYLATLAAQEVSVTVQPWMPITEDQRGYLHAVLVEIYREHCGYATHDEAYDKLIRAVYRLPEDVDRPSFSDASSDGFQMSEAIERISAYLVVDCQLRVPDPEPNPMERAS